MKLTIRNKVALSTALLTAWCAFGCGQSSDEHPSNCSSSSSGAGGGGLPVTPNCVWAGSGGGVTFPTCPAPDTGEFMGTIDGQPYDYKDKGVITAMAVPFHPPYSLSRQVGPFGYLDIGWPDPFVRGRWTSGVAGETLLPGDKQARNIYPDSQLLFSCEDYSFLYILHVDGGQLTGCSR